MPPLRTSLRNSDCTVLFQSTAVAWESWQVIIVKKPATWVFRWSESGLCIHRAISDSGLPPKDGKRPPMPHSIEMTRPSVQPSHLRELLVELLSRWEIVL